MKTPQMLKIVKNSLLVTVALGGLGYGVVLASEVENFVSPKQAIKAEGKAVKALGKHDYLTAIRWGEQAVLGDARNADYRLVLAQAYLSAGRFASAETLFNDVLTLDPARNRAALNLALTQIALDHGADARATLDTHRDLIAPADLGLAYALAGDAPNGVRILETAARGEAATAKTRQNLALAYALAGRWDEARVAASQDLSPDMVEKRMSDWAQMSHPKAAWDQVATLLHVTPVNDSGLPYQLALHTAPNAPALAANTPAVPAPAPLAAAPPAPAESAPRYEVAAASETPAAPAIAQAEPQPVAIPVAAYLQPVRFAPKQANAQPLPAKLITAEPGPAKRFIVERVRTKSHPAMVALAKPHPVSQPAQHHSFQNGHFAVQIGAFATEAVAKAAWQRDAKKVAVLRSYDPAGSHFKLRHSSFYRLAVTGFTTHGEAVQVCAQLRASGSACFVRGVAGDQLAAWAHPVGNVKMAAQVKPHSLKPVVKTAHAVVPKAVHPVVAQAKPVIKSTPKQVITAHAAGGQLAAKR